MIKCEFYISVDNQELYLDSAYVDSHPEKDEEGNWRPILMNFKPDDNGPIWEIFSKFFKLGPTSDDTFPNLASALLSIDDGDAYVLYNIWPKSLRFGLNDNNNCEVLWRFNGTTLFRK